jgi:hypothetical protein
MEGLQPRLTLVDLEGESYGKSAPGTLFHAREAVPTLGGVIRLYLAVFIQKQNISRTYIDTFWNIAVLASVTLLCINFQQCRSPVSQRDRSIRDERHGFCHE